MTPTTDLCDANEDKIAAGTLRVVEPMFQSWGMKSSFMGQAHTLKVFEDNSLVRSALEKDGQGKVLVVDGGGSMRWRALWCMAACATPWSWMNVMWEFVPWLRTP
jgi:regulator of ribonuclease activity A